MNEAHPLLGRIRLGVLTVLLVVIAWNRRAVESLLLLLPARPASRPPRPVRATRGGIARQEVPLAGE
ncbi:hypothetical protein MTQ10_15835 [Streptomyces sp. XM83C]|jgi:hypothetical protein|uniref:Uncharacterized protein n=1 Tax=Streptomyces thermocoprophilus TaxID=78356 RepID=A0ABV5VH49_9ACTN|nr:hypothetical protein [Streptomyces sp. XM83C]MCK1821042.1 hypothetical protein [Streptomyces sp. XM83C]